MRIAHGKDRCANPPRSGPQGMASSSASAGGARRGPSGTVPGVVVNGEVPDEGEEGGDGVGNVAFLVDAGVVGDVKAETQEVEVSPVVV